MARLTAAQRKAIPSSKFGLPGKAQSASGKAKPGSYPMPDRKHAALAKAMDHNASPAQRKQIDAKANRILGKSAGGAKKAAPKKGK